MKKLLLTSALVAVAGAAAAEITWSGSAEVYFNDSTEVDVADLPIMGNVINGVVLPADETLYLKNTFYDEIFGEGTSDNPLKFEVGLTASASAELDNGVTATLSYDFDLEDNNVVDSNGDSNRVFTFDNNFPTLTIEGSQFKLSIGSVDHAAHDLFGGHSEKIEFTEEDGELVARLDGNVAGFKAAVDYTASDVYGDGDHLNEESVTFGAVGEFAGASVTLAYENRANTHVDTKGEFVDTSVFGISGGYSWNGVTGVVSYVTGDTDNDDEAESSVGLTGQYEWNGYTIYGEWANYDNGLSTDTLTNYDYAAWEIGAKGEVSGATFAVGYYDEDTEVDNDVDVLEVNEGFFIDLAYEWNGATFQAGYDSGEFISYHVDEPSDQEDLYGAFYTGMSYDIGEGASVYATYATADELDPAEDIRAGLSVGMKLSF